MSNYRKEIAGLLLIALLWASSSALAGGLPRNEDAYHTGQDVSDAYVDPEQYAVDQSLLKAVGFDYDYDSLTYELVWADEFDTNGRPDAAHWRYDTGGSGCSNSCTIFLDSSRCAKCSKFCS